MAANLSTALFLADLAESDDIGRQPEKAYQGEIETAAADHFIWISLFPAICPYCAGMKFITVR
jgi:hypothetical protein